MMTVNCKLPKSIIDFGSKSAKFYSVSDNGEITLIRNLNWSPLENHNDDYISVYKEKLNGIISELEKPVISISTAISRRKKITANFLEKICCDQEINYEEITQEREIELLKNSLPKEVGKFDIYNVGGGSIQIVTKVGNDVLLDFGISDLNNLFSLNKNPSERKINECLDFLNANLPSSKNSFIYTGGERTYLKKLQVSCDDHGSCHINDFLKMHNKIKKLSNVELESISPFGSGWMSGAIASNCIIISALNKSKQYEFYANDNNIAEGLIRELYGKNDLIF